MRNIILIQLPIPQLNLGMRIGNIPLAAACLKHAAGNTDTCQITIFPEIQASYLGDAALIDLILQEKPDVIGFTVFSWNVERSVYIAEKLKENTHFKIIFGGPEVTPDNPLVYSNAVDFLVFGEGEAIFTELLKNEPLWQKKSGSHPAGDIFRQSPSPYLKGLIDSDVNNLMYLETQRGCPYGCGFCYYNKSRRRMIFAAEDQILKGVRWAVDHNMEELCLLDPSLNLRPGLKTLLKKIQKINPDKTLGITGEIRAEAIDGELADLFFHAGFTGFEIGLQTTNAPALEMMNRPTDLQKFLDGARRLKERDILPRIDLIIGLPGDTLDGFKNSIDFLEDHDLLVDVQVFALSVLPGTDFRKNSEKLGLYFDTAPPYTIQRTLTFSDEDILEAFDYAESVLNVSLFPEPYLDIAFAMDDDDGKDIGISIKGRQYISKILLNTTRDIAGLEKISERVTHPYQIFIAGRVNDTAYIQKVLSLVTSKNPFTPVEVIFLDPDKIPDTDHLLNAVNIKRPHYLDVDLRYLYGREGNRTVLFTLVTKNRNLCFTGHMKRQIFHWENPTLPGQHDIEALADLDGILIDSGHPTPETEINRFQDRFCSQADALPYICFSKISHQKRWLKLTAGDEFSY